MQNIGKIMLWIYHRSNNIHVWTTTTLHGFTWTWLCVYCIPDWMCVNRSAPFSLIWINVSYIPNRSLTPANVITSDATNKSAMANDAKNKFPIRRKLRSVYIAKHTKIFPAIDKNIKSDKKMPANIEKKQEREKKQTLLTKWTNGYLWRKKVKRTENEIFYRFIHSQFSSSIVRHIKMELQFGFLFATSALSFCELLSVIKCLFMIFFFGKIGIRTNAPNSNVWGRKWRAKWRIDNFDFW